MRLEDSHEPLTHDAVKMYVFFRHQRSGDWRVQVQLARECAVHSFFRAITIIRILDLDFGVGL